MSTQVLGGQKRSRAIVALVALALTLAVVLLATEARSIWSTRGGSQVQRAPARIAPTANTEIRYVGHIPAGCRVKFGCDRGGNHQEPAARSERRIPDGCRVKFGCQADAGRIEGH